MLLKPAEAQPVSRMFRKFREHLHQREFKPHPLLRGGHLQTMIAPRLRREFPWGWSQFEERFVELENGPRIRIHSAFQHKEAPTLVAVHGMGGSSSSVYMQGLSHKAFRSGWNALLLNLYDTNLEGDRPHILHSGSSREVAQVLERLISELQLRDLYLAGVSMGGNILLKLMGEWGEDFLPQVRRAAVISPLVDLTISWQTLESLSSTIYRLHFIRGLKRIVRRHGDYLAPFVDLPSVMKIRTIREFDEAVTAPLGGYENAHDYYEKSSAAPLLKNIRVPTLILHSKDDPLLPWEPFVRPETQQNPFLLVALTEAGGHVGFIEQHQVDIDRAWAENRVIDFFQA